MINWNGKDMERRADKYLSQVELFRVKVKIKEDEIRELKETLGIHCQAQLERVQTGVNIDAISNEVIKYLNTEDELTRCKTELVEARDRIINEIFRLSDKYHVQILTLFYVKDWPMTKIAADLHYSEAHTYRLYHAALQAFYEVVLKPLYREKNKKRP